jgi:hypothetical protein
VSRVSLPPRLPSLARAALALAACAFALPLPALADLAVRVEIDTTAPRTPISPLIYGANHDHPGWQGATLRRWGGNATDTYNWENGFNNAGHDWQQNNGAWLTRYVPRPQAGQPAAAIIHFHEESLRRGVPTIVGLPLVGYVAADADGPVAPEDAPPSSRWKKVVAAKGAPFAATPDLADDTVYVDELVAYLTARFGPADSPRGIRYYALGNEPGLWPTTHPLIHRQPVSARHYVDRAIELAIAVKRVDPTALVIGPSCFGLYELDSFCNAPDWPQIKAAGGYHWFADFVLAEFARASEREGRRLLDVFSFHHYLEGEIPAHGGVIGILQSPRTLWDPAYHEPSYLGEVLRHALGTLPRLRESISRHYPGTALGITEYDRGDPDGFAGGLALADTLGIFGREGVELATAWPLTGFDQEKPGRYAAAANRLYRDYDGRGGAFGSLLLAVNNSDDHASSAYAAADPATGALHLILINKNLHATNRVQVELRGADAPYRSATAHGFDEHEPALRPMPGVGVITDNRFTYSVPRRSAVHLVINQD